LACSSTEYIEARIERTEEMIEALENAIEQLSIQGIHSYDLDTGQNRSRVTRQDLPRLNQMLDTLDSRLSRLCKQLANLNGGLSIQVAPSW